MKQRSVPVTVLICALTVLGCLLVAHGLFYWFIGFSVLSWDPMLWTEDQRVGFMTGGSFVGLIGSIFACLGITWVRHAA